MSWYRESSTMVSVDDLAWISNFLSTYDGDLLEFELDVDCQHFFDNMDVALAQESPNGHRQSPLQLTPFVLSVISDLHDSVKKSEKDEEPSISFCQLLKEAQSAGKCERKARHATTAPRSSRRLKRQRKITTAAASSANSQKRTTRSSSRRIINRRLFQ